jgi:hypothetical protein
MIGSKSGNMENRLIRTLRKVGRKKIIFYSAIIYIEYETIQDLLSIEKPGTVTVKLSQHTKSATDDAKHEF